MGKEKDEEMKKVIVGIILLAVLGVSGCGDTTKKIVDGKAILTECPPGPIYLLEIDSEDAMSSSEEEGPENYVCVSKAEYDANEVSEEWRSANGGLK